MSRIETTIPEQRFAGLRMQLVTGKIHLIVSDENDTLVFYYAVIGPTDTVISY